jgi:hypothetical protein
MVKSREHVTTNGRAVFFAAMWEDFRNAALDCGWALGLHGSLNSDMDIMAMPWTAEAVPAEELIQALLNCFDDSIWKEKEYKPFTGKPHGRIVYTISIFADFYLDISIIDVNSGVKGIVFGTTGVIGHPDPIGEPGVSGFKGIALGNNDPIGVTENVEHPIPNQINKIEFMEFQYLPPSPPEVTNQVEPAYITVNKNGATSPFVIEFFPPLPEAGINGKDEFNPLGDFIKEEIAIWDSGNGYDLVKIESGDVVFGNITVEILTGKFPGRSSFPPSEIFKYSKELCDSLALRYGYERTTTTPATDE